MTAAAATPAAEAAFTPAPGAAPLPRMIAAQTADNRRHQRSC